MDEKKEVMPETTLRQLNDLARQFAEVRNQKEEAESALKNINKQIDELQMQIISIMTDEGMPSFRLENMGLLYISMPARPKIVNKEAFFKWLEDNNEAYIIKPAIHWKTLGTWFKQIKERFDKEDKDIQEELKEMLSVYEEPQLNLRRE